MNTVWDVRAFQNTADYYYVQEEADFFYSVNENAQTWLNSAGSDPNHYNQLSSIPGLIDPVPGNTVCTNTTSSSFTWSASGSVGWNQTQGLNASTGGGVSVTKTKGLSCPQTIITNQSNPSLSQPGWLYSSPVPNQVQTNIFINQWVWEVPFKSYPSGTQSFTIESGAASKFSDTNFLTSSVILPVPLPFGDTFALQNPTVLSANPNCVLPGSTFAINGTGMYPALVTGVVIGGMPLTASQYSKGSDTLLQVIAPNQPGEAPQPVVVQTALGLSNSNVTIEIPYLFCD